MPFYVPRPEYNAETAVPPRFNPPSEKWINGGLAATQALISIALASFVCYWLLKNRHSLKTSIQRVGALIVATATAVLAVTMVYVGTVEKPVLNIDLEYRSRVSVTRGAI